MLLKPAQHRCIFGRDGTKLKTRTLPLFHNSFTKTLICLVPGLLTSAVDYGAIPTSGRKATQSVQVTG